MAKTSKRRHPGRMLLLGLPMLLGLLLAGGGIVAMGFARPVLPTTASISIASPYVVPAHPLPWPKEDNAALVIPALQVHLSASQERQAPIASVTKIMTALVLIRDFPLSLGEEGPSLVMGASAVDDWTQTVHEGGSNIEVQEKEVLSLHQCLEALLVRSANNIARVLAKYDAGSVEQFTEKMNAYASELGMTHTHYVEPSGFEAGSVSTPSDQLIAAQLLYANPVLRDIVGRSYVDLPVVGRVASYTPLITVKGVKGIKSGRTDDAGGCDVMAYERSIRGKTVTVFTAIMGRTGGDVLTESGLVALDLSRHALDLVRQVQLSKRGRIVGRSASWWGTTPLVEDQDLKALVFVGLPLQRSLATKGLLPGSPRGADAGMISYVAPGLKVSIPLVSAEQLPKLRPWTRVR
ncbi:MAG: hypothetical protein WCJ28_04350 [Actinomycetota bacterium]